MPRVVVSSSGSPWRERERFRVSICHCLACQRRTGSVFGVQARFDVEQVSTEGAFRRYRNRGHFGGRVRRSFLPCADEVGLGGAATSVAAASRRHRTRALTGGEVTRLGQRSGMSPERKQYSRRRLRREATNQS